MTPSADTTTTTTTMPVTGQQLGTLMNRLEADLEESDSSRETDLAARLRAQPLRADTLDAVARLHTLWMHAGDPAAARAVIDVDGALVHEAAPPDARPDIRMQLALYRLQVGHHLREHDSVAQAIGEMHEVVRTSPTLDAERYVRLRMLDTLERDGAAHSLDAIELRHALNGAIAGRARFRAWDEADRQCRRAWALQRLDRAADARAAAEAAVAALGSAAADQDIDAYDWLRIGHAIIEIAPLQLDTIRQAVEARVADWALPPRREVEVRVARLAARAARAQGDLDGALAQCAFARHSLESDGGDDFVEYELPWLIEAGRFDEAGRRAFFHVYQIEGSMLDTVGHIVHARLADPSDTSVWWPLCVMRAAGFGPTLERLIELGQQWRDPLASGSPVHAALFAALGSLDGDARRHAIADAARELAAQRAPGHPWIARLAAAYDGENGRIDATTQAARLLAAAQEGDLHDNRTAFVLFGARIRALGVAAALKLPPPSLPSGLWSYAFAVSIEDEVDDALEALPAAQRDDVRADLARLQTAVYEQGRACMERFFETGNGHPYDACAHLYSMLCNNLAILYRGVERYDDSLQLHRNGIAASPFAEHYDGIRYVLTCQGKDDEMLEAAEQLWHYAAENGYSRHGPNGYLRDVVRALSRVERSNEMPIWLERLVGWQRDNDQVDGNLPAEALSARFIFATYMTASHPDQAAALYDAARAQAIASSDLSVQLDAGNAAYQLRRDADVKRFYEHVLAANPHAAEPLDLNVELIEQRIREASGLEPAADADPVPAGSNKRWWKFWQ
ncbi:hypothetical protein LGN24_05520 [Burkholderia seminalis]|uniref:hypothetical protein n=1 Tax=Burkholderia seminalis TaxID=488731 RepID=UPI001CF4D8B3|nr:hypothetical protein [Burkholderia seminalis]MCA8300944.1 hypothetical protein [Burkholderia seminalis]